MAENSSGNLDRRSALKLFVSGAAAGSVPLGRAAADPAAPPADPSAAMPRLTATDPSLTQPAKCPWPKILTAPERKTAAALADLILPADESTPSASQAGVVEFLDEWVSAPYPDQLKDRELVRGGLSWLNTESTRRFQKGFAALDAASQAAICDDICIVEKARPDLRAAALFFVRFRDLCLTGYYTTAAGFADLGYKGNMPLPKFDGPPPEVLKHLGLA